MSEIELKKWKTSSSKYIVNDRWLKLRADSCITPEGHVIEPFYIFEYPNWFNCFVVDENLDVVMVRHYRHGIDEYVLELVCGGIDEEDSSPETAIRRELEEEIGYVGGEIYQTGVSYSNPANQTSKVYSFFAFGGSCSQQQKLGKGENLYIEKITFKDLVNRVNSSSSNETYQSMHLVSIFFALNFIKQSDAARLRELKKFI